MLHSDESRYEHSETQQPAIIPHVKQDDYRLWMVLLVLGAFAWRVHALGRQSLWRDEVDAIWFATRDLPDTLAMFVQAAQNGPLYFLSLRPWFSLVGSSEIALRYPSAMASILAIPLLYQLARRLLPSKHALPPRTPDSTRTVHAPTTPSTWMALLAAALFAFHPYQLWYGQEGKMYALMTLLVLAASWGWWRAVVERRRWAWPAYWLAITSGLYVHLLFILVLPVHLVWFIILWPHSRGAWRGYATTMAALFLPYVPLFIWQWEFLWSEAQLTYFRFTPLADALETLLTRHTQGFAPPVAHVWLGPLYFLAGMGLALGWSEIGLRAPTADTPALASPRRYLLVLAWIVVPIASIYLLSLRQPVFTDRYIVWIGPALTLLVALGAESVRTHAAWLARTISTLLVAYVLIFWLYAGWQQKHLPLKFDLRGAVHHVAERRAPGELLILQIPHLAWAYGYYTSDQGPRPFESSDTRLDHWLGGLWTNHDWPDDVAWQDAQLRMAAATRENGAERPETLWVLFSETAMWDNRGLLERWLAENAELLESANFTGVQARHYRVYPAP